MTQTDAMIDSDVHFTAGKMPVFKSFTIQTRQAHHRAREAHVHKHTISFRISEKLPLPVEWKPISESFCMCEWEGRFSKLLPKSMPDSEHPAAHRVARSLEHHRPILSRDSVVSCSTGGWREVKGSSTRAERVRRETVQK